MRIPPSKSPRKFLTRFFELIYGPDDLVVICTLTPRPAGKLRWDTYSIPRSRAIEYAIILWEKKTSNLYFRAAAHDGSTSYGKANCVHTGALFLDVDYGKAGEGHKEKTPFATADDAFGYILTLPLRPSLVWHTGHGFQACYLLDKPYAFPPGGGASDSLDRFEDVSRRLTLMAMGDKTFTPEHAFRIPLTINSKRHDHPELPDVTGTVFLDTDRRYTFEEIEQACSEYGVDEYMAGNDDDKEVGRPWGAETDDVASDDLPPDDVATDDVVREDVLSEDVATDDLTTDDMVPGNIDCAYEELSKYIRNRIEEHYPQGERSDRLYGIVGYLVKRGYSDASIRDAIYHGQSFLTYGPDLDRHIILCLDKLRYGKRGSGKRRTEQRAVYSTEMAPPITITVTSEEVPLSDCTHLPDALDAMLSYYFQVTRASVVKRVWDAARFHEHQFNTYKTGVLESPCGSGKSTWAFAHIAVNAGPDHRYAYVVETVDALYRAAATLEELTGQPVGRVHGFNSVKCAALSKREHHWRDCGAKHQDSVCHACDGRTKCYFYLREAEEKKPILCMTHSGFASALEREDTLLVKDVSVIVDEQLSPMNTATFTKDELDNLQNFGSTVKSDLGEIFPYSLRSQGVEFASWEVMDSADTFARHNYIFRDKQATTKLAKVYKSLRKLQARKLEPLNPFRPGDKDRAEETLGQLLNFFHPTRQEDATYAYKEDYDPVKGLRYSVARNRFRLNSKRPYRKLWILNASAQLTADAYPEDMTVYRCPDLIDSSYLLTIHVVRNNPTKSRQDESVMLSEVLLRLGPDLRAHRKVMVATDADERSRPEIKRQLEALHGEDVSVEWLTRGRIKGSNDAGDCTLAYLTGMSVFTTLSDCALRACLHTGRTFSENPNVLNDFRPNWKGGLPIFTAMRTVYALRALDELYQTIWRTAVRNDEPAHAVIAVPRPEWLIALWKTVAPRFKMGLALKDVKGEEDEADEAEDTEKAVEVVKREKSSGPEYSPPLSRTFVADDQLNGLRLINLLPGTEIKKMQVALEFGYSGRRGWERHEDLLQRWLEPFFECGHHTLTRKPFHGMRVLTYHDENKKCFVCKGDDLKAILEVIKDAAQAYDGVIPADCLRKPYMTATVLKAEIEMGVEFWGVEYEGELAGVMGLQYGQNETLIRHAYVKTSHMRTGLGSRLLNYLPTVIRPPFIVIAWASTSWALDFYKKHDFLLISSEDKDRLLAEFGGIPQEQIKASVVLADAAWLKQQKK